MHKTVLIYFVQRLLLCNVTWSYEEIMLKAYFVLGICMHTKVH